MKIFKNRGDIYIPKSDYKRSREKNILLILLAITVIITIVFIIFMNKNYPTVFSFFADGEISTTAAVNNNDTALPQISGKTNYLFVETDDDETNIHYAVLIQADKDNLAYKVATLSPQMTVNGKSLFKILSTDGGAGLQKDLSEYFGFEIDYYACFKDNDFTNFADIIGKFAYKSDKDIRHDGGSGDDTYTIRLRKGESYLDGEDFSNLMRYYSVDTKNYSAANELVLYGLTELFNEKNYEDCESLFRLFNKSASTNISVRNFEDNKNSVEVFCYKNTDITVYGCVPIYSETALTQESLKDVKGYFSK